MDDLLAAIEDDVSNRSTDGRPDSVEASEGEELSIAEILASSPAAKVVVSVTQEEPVQAKSLVRVLTFPIYLLLARLQKASVFPVRVCVTQPLLIDTTVPGCWF